MLILESSVEAPHLLGDLFGSGKAVTPFPIKPQGANHDDVKEDLEREVTVTPSDHTAVSKASPLSSNIADHDFPYSQVEATSLDVSDLETVAAKHEPIDMQEAKNRSDVVSVRAARKLPGGECMLRLHKLHDVYGDDPSITWNFGGQKPVKYKVRLPDVTISRGRYTAKRREYSYLVAASNYFSSKLQESFLLY